jgi:hypothetical protein
MPGRFPANRQEEAPSIIETASCPVSHSNVSIFYPVRVEKKDTKKFAAVALQLNRITERFS